MRSHLILLILILTGSPVMAVEEAPYIVVKTYDNFELRAYKAQIVAETIVGGSFDDVGNTAFRILFDYISGNNVANGKIAMTAPVTQNSAKSEKTKIAMTAPVTQFLADQDTSSEIYAVRFVMPANYTLDSTPKPVDQRVIIREIPEKQFAVLRYSGRWGEDTNREKETILLQSVNEAGLKIVNSPVFARYNSPFALWFMRRNEVLIEVEMKIED